MFEIIVVDDGSTDGSLEIIKEFAKKNSNIPIKVHSKENAGFIDSLNLALSKCSTKFIYFVGSDDIPQNEGIDKLIEINKIYLSQNYFVLGGAVNLYQESNVTSSTYNTNTELFLNKLIHVSPLDFDKLLFLKYPHPLLIQSAIFNVEKLIQIGGWDIDLINDDYQIFVKIFYQLQNQKTEVNFSNEIKTVYYRHHGNNSYKNYTRQYYSIEQIINKYCRNKIIKFIALIKNRVYFSFKLIFELRFVDFVKLQSGKYRPIK